MASSMELFLRDLVCDRIRDGIHRVDSKSQNEGFNCSYPYKKVVHLKAGRQSTRTDTLQFHKKKTHIRRDHLWSSSSWMYLSHQGPTRVVFTVSTE